jgi:hypothetical protein
LKAGHGGGLIGRVLAASTRAYCLLS